MDVDPVTSHEGGHSAPHLAPAMRIADDLMRAVHDFRILRIAALIRMHAAHHIAVRGLECGAIKSAGFQLKDDACNFIAREAAP